VGENRKKYSIYAGQKVKEEKDLEEKLELADYFIIPLLALIAFSLIGLVCFKNTGFINVSGIDKNHVKQLKEGTVILGNIVAFLMSIFCVIHVAHGKIKSLIYCAVFGGLILVASHFIVPFVF
jgi:hypothetical protein